MERLSGYDLIERIGKGGMAEVFLARRSVEGVDRRMVIKRILPEFCLIPEFVQMFLNEAQVAARLEHPNITQLVDFGQENGSYFLAIEYVQGTDFGRLMAAASDAGQFLPIELVLKICALSAEALGYAHDLVDEEGQPLGFVHRDVSPDNILLGSNGAVKVSDFGIARMRSLPKVTQTGMLKGKPHYAAPEYLAGKGSDHRADIYALGTVLYQAIAGVRPFDGPTLIEVMRAVVTQPPPDIREIRPDVPEAVVQIIERALQKDPANRYPYASAMVEDLEAALHQMGRSATGRAISELVIRYFPKGRSMMTPAPVPMESTHIATPTGRGTPAKGGTGQMPTIPVQSAARTQPGRKAPTTATVPLQDAAPAQTEPVRAAARPRSKAASKWAAPESEIADADTAASTRLSAVAQAHRDALELADQKLSPEEEASRRPGYVKGEKRVLPTSAFIVIGVMLFPLVFAFRYFMPHSRAVLQGVQVSNTAEKTLVVTSNIAGADVVIDGQFKGKTPLTLENDWGFGTHVPITVNSMGWTSVETQFVGGRGQKVDVTFGETPEAE